MSVIKSPLGGWFGGKFYLCKKIIPLIPEHICYCEPFFGAGWVYFRKKPSTIEIINDKNAELINLWQLIQKEPEALYRHLEYALASRFIYESYRDMSEEEVAALTREERAWRLLYLLKLSMNGKGIGGKAAFMVRRKGKRRFNQAYIAENIGKANARLKKR